jgi:solute carrier family 6 serotonin transporter-like protein 4
LIRGVLLEGSSLGIKYYLYPDWYKLLDVDVWVEAAKQIYFSLGPGFGTLMALSSYNRFNHNCRR